jgi:RNA polymerase sigma factor (sigma-70 family)
MEVKPRNPRTHPISFDEVLEHHTPYVISVAGTYAHGDQTLFQDLYNVGLEGLWYAFNPENKKWDRKRRFSTYAYDWVMQRILLCKAKQPLIHIPIRKLQRDWKAKKQRHLFLSLDFELEDKDNQPATLHSVLADESDSPSQSLEQKEQQELYDRAFSKLNPAEKQVINGRMAGMTLDELSMKLNPSYKGKVQYKKVKNVTRERVRQIEEAALNKLRKWCRPSIQERLMLS